MKEWAVFVICSMLVAVGVAGCFDKVNSQREMERQEAVGKKVAIDSFVGKRIVSISGLEKPIVITVEGGGRLEISCIKYSIQTKATPSN